MLTAQELTDLLRLSLVDIDPVWIELWYDAGKLFGGHDVAIALNHELQFLQLDLRG